MKRLATPTMGGKISLVLLTAYFASELCLLIPMAMAQTVDVLPNAFIFAAFTALFVATFPLDFLFMATLGSFWTPIMTYGNELIHIILRCADCFILGYLLAYVWHSAKRFRAKV